MRRRWRDLVLLLAGLSFGAPVRANDSAFRGAPADLFPQAQSNESMESEDILLVATHSEWRVVAKYVFKTASKQNVPVQIGFPELRCWDDEYAPCLQTRRFQDMKTLVDGKAVALTEGTLSKRAEWSSYLGTIWLFNVEFPPEGRITIEHRYRVETGESSNGDRFMEYVIRTGSLWGGPIGHAHFTVRFPAYAFEVEAQLTSEFKVTPPRIVDGPEPYVELVVEAKAFRPTKDLQFRFNARADQASVSEGIPSFEQVQRDGTSEAVRDRMNLLYASKGFEFRSKELRARFYQDKVAFEPIPNFQGRWSRKLRAFSAFRPDWFTREDRDELKWLEKRRDELKISVDLPGQVGSGAPAGSVAPTAQAVSGKALVPAATSTRVASGALGTSAAAPSAAHGAEKANPRGACGCDVPGRARSNSPGVLGFALLGCSVLLARGCSTRLIRSRRPRRALQALHPSRALPS
jgi:hypothetical protein